MHDVQIALRRQNMHNIIDTVLSNAGYLVLVIGGTVNMAMHPSF